MAVLLAQSVGMFVVTDTEGIAFIEMDAVVEFVQVPVAPIIV